MPATLTGLSTSILSSTSPLPSAQGSGPLSVLNSNPYDLNVIQYPIDGLGSNDVPHYMMFNINLPTASKYFQSNPQALTSGPNQNSASQQNSQLLASQGLSTATAPPTAGQIVGGTAISSGASALGLSSGSALQSAVGGAAVLSTSSGLGVSPKTKRISTSISLYMPETLQFNYGQQWNTVSLTEAMGSIGKFAAIGSSADSIIKEVMAKGGQFGDLVKKSWNGKRLPSSEELQSALRFNNAVPAELLGQLAEATGAAGPNYTALVLRSMNKAINPKQEMLFQGTENRQFQFDFDLQPRSQKEAYAIYQLIRAFKIFSAPEYSAEAAGRYMIPPALFDISFYYMNTINRALPAISTCALTQVQTNYNASGPFATFNDGFPVHTHLSLVFTEIDIITRELIQAFGY